MALNQKNKTRLATGSELVDIAYKIIRQGGFRDGLALLSKAYADRPDFGGLGLPLWNGGKPKGKRILFYCEHGAGDQIVNVRFAKWLVEQGAIVEILVSSSLVSLFSCVGASKITAIHPPKNLKFGERFDIKVSGNYHGWVPSGDAAYLLGFEAETIPFAPYLEPSLPHYSKWSDIFPERAGNLRAGIRWQGNPWADKDGPLGERTLPTQQMFKLANIPGVQLFSLQRDVERIEMPESIIDLGEKLETWDDTAAAIMHLDLVISSCTSVAHLAAAMNKPTWVLEPGLNYHVWASNDDRTPWYSSVRLFRRINGESWQRPLWQVHHALTELVESER